MMTVDEVILQVKRTRCYPFHLDAMVSKFSAGIELQCLRQVPDLETKNMGPLCIKKILAFECLDAFNAAILSKILRELCYEQSRHEVDEWFESDGRHIFNPHMSMLNE